jgi:L-serine dehydratase
MFADDMRIPDSFEIAKQNNLEISIGAIHLKNVHPNTAVLKVVGKSNRSLEVVASSVGGGAIKICKIDGLEANFTGSNPTLIIHNIDQPGHVAEVASTLSHKGINIATMHLYRDKRGGFAVMVIETDQNIPRESIQWLEHLEGVMKVTYLNLEDN